MPNALITVFVVVSGENWNDVWSDTASAVFHRPLASLAAADRGNPLGGWVRVANAPPYSWSMSVLRGNGGSRE